MLTTIIPTALMIPTIALLKPKTLFPISLSFTMALAITTLPHLKQNYEFKSHTDYFTSLDNISSPLLMLSYWLLPVMILASQKSLTPEPMARQRTFLLTLLSLQTFIALTFATSNLLALYIMFEATLIPTLILITRWGHQAERMSAGVYFMFYTLLASMPLLIAILNMNFSLTTTLFLPTKIMMEPQTHPILWTACLIAFLTKMPMYGVHLWLPKAHVEAPIAGSMVLAAILLKLGGFGIIRMAQTLPPTGTTSLLTPLLTLAIWGATMANFTCLQQTDLKSLIAYSSVGHMGLVIGATLTQSPTSLAGAMILMIAHGFSSSMLFCLANMNYERTHTRTLTLTRGLQNTLPMMTAWWLMASLMNMALPPSANFTGELLIISALFNWSPPMILLLGTNTLITATYTLHMFLSTQTGKLPTNLKPHQPAHTREHLLLAMHTAPLIIISMKPHLIT